MQDVLIYTKAHCPYCHAAKSLLSKKNVAFSEIAVTTSGQQAEMVTKSHGKTSVPQIWIGQTHVGGCDDLYALEDGGKLDALLAG
jgi:glutaredoxin 3